MVSKSVKVAPIIYDYLDRHPKVKLKRVKTVYKEHSGEAIKSAFYRWHRRKHLNEPSKRSDSVSKDNDTVSQKGKKGGSAGKETKDPTNLSKIDEHLLEEYLLSLVDFDHPDVRIAREMSSFIDRKKGFKQEETVKIEFLGVDLDEQIALAEAYRTDIESEVSE